MNFIKSLATVTAVCSLSALSAGAHADNRIRILSPNWSGYAPVFVAEDLGYFKQLGIDVSLKFEDERPNVMAAMAHGDIEMDMRTVGEYQGRPRADDTPGVIIGTIDESLGGDGVVSDGSIKSVADLKGKTIASEPNIPARLLLQMELKKKGLTLSDLKLKEISTADSVAVFSDKSIAAVATYQPFLSQAVSVNAARSPRLLVSSREHPGVIVDVLIVRQDDLKANPDKYRKFLIGIFKAINYYKTNPDQFVKIAAPHYKLSADEFKQTIVGSLEYTDFARTSAYFGTKAKAGPAFGVFDQVMSLNLENGAADHRLTANKEIDADALRSISASDLK
jgi:NitT/TauT family transport system substrate-binding protein